MAARRKIVRFFIDNQRFAFLGENNLVKVYKKYCQNVKHLYICINKESNAVKT